MPNNGGLFRFLWVALNKDGHFYGMDKSWLKEIEGAHVYRGDVENALKWGKSLSEAVSILEVQSVTRGLAKSIAPAMGAMKFSIKR